MKKFIPFLALILMTVPIIACDRDITASSVDVVSITEPTPAVILPPFLSAETFSLPGQTACNQMKMFMPVGLDPRITATSSNSSITVVSTPRHTSDGPTYTNKTAWDISVCITSTTATEGEIEAALMVPGYPTSRSKFRARFFWP